MDITTKVVLIEKCNNGFHYRKLDIVKEIWIHGIHPEECRGCCEIYKGFLMSKCLICGWNNSHQLNSKST